MWGNNRQVRDVWGAKRIDGDGMTEAIVLCVVAVVGIIVAQSHPVTIPVIGGPAQYQSNFGQFSNDFFMDFFC